MTRRNVQAAARARQEATPGSARTYDTSVIQRFSRWPTCATRWASHRARPVAGAAYRAAQCRARYGRYSRHAGGRLVAQADWSFVDLFL